MKKYQQDLKDFDDQMKLRNFSLSTRQAYGCALGQFLEWREQKGYDTIDLNQDQAREYILKRYDAGKKWQTINGDYSSIRKFFCEIKDLPWSIKKLPRPRKEKTLPRILSKAEIQKIIEHGATFKHQVFMTFLYATGLRLGEARHLKTEHINGERRQICVVKGKGAKDRYVDLPEGLLVLLRTYYRQYRPNVYLFNGERQGVEYAPRTIQRFIKESANRAKVRKTVSPHIFRHSYATHHLENGTDLVYLKQQLGHKHLRTTAQYIHLMKEHSWRINHPIADMEIKFSNPI